MLLKGRFLKLFEGFILVKTNKYFKKFKLFNSEFDYFYLGVMKWVFVMWPLNCKFVTVCCASFF